ncbi:MAG: peptidyl-prolyl cis-trans isomerase [Flavobacteriaceae bacterium]|nr:peptidyl-prolyl cis-trans isomerase [Flavobacteriaceae bacterium]
MKKILKEPFFHFILIGIVLFLLYGMVSEKSNSKNSIIINDFDVNSLIASWEQQWKRLPTEKELQNLINLKVKQEIFYQEALKMNLDHNDEIIKRRLAQKMQFLSNDIASLKDPSDEELQAYYKANASKYLTPATYSLYQITFSADHRNDNFKDATEILKAFENASFEEMKDKGDALPFSYNFIDVTSDELSLQLGSKFSEALKDQKINQWVGPVPSGFGYHLVYITEKTEPQLPDFDVNKKDVIQDYEYDIEKEMNELMYQELKKNYNIEIDIKSKDFDPKFSQYLQKVINE